MRNMLKKVKKLIVAIENGEYSGREIFLTGVVLFLLGLVLGAIFSPRKIQVFGSGNGNSNYMPNDEDKDIEVLDCEK